MRFCALNYTAGERCMDGVGDEIVYVQRGFALPGEMILLAGQQWYNI